MRNNRYKLEASSIPAHTPTPRHAMNIEVDRQGAIAINHELIWGTLVGLTFVTALAFPFWSNYYSTICPMKLIAGIPCVLCGGTRAVSAWTHGDFYAAFTLNPLAALLSVFMAAYLIYAAAVLIINKQWRIRFDPGALSVRTRVCIGGAVLVGLALNWAYLITAGR